MLAEGSGGSNTSVCQPRSRNAVGSSGPGGHNWAAVALSRESVPVWWFQELCWLNLEPSFNFLGLPFPPRAAEGLQ